MAKNQNLNLLKNLKGYKESKEKAASFTGEFEQVPNGRYDARVTGAEVRLSKNKEAMCCVSLIITGDSEEEGRKISSFIMLEGAGAALHVFEKVLGYDLPEDSEDLGDIINDLASSEKDVLIEVKNGFASIIGTNDEPAIASGDEDETEEVDESSDTEEDKPTEEVDQEDSEEETIGVGDTVSFTWKGETLEGVIISEDGTSAKIKSGTKTYPVKLEAIQGKVETEDVVEEEEIEEEEEVEEKPKKQPAPKKGTTVAKKVAAKPAVKKVAKKK